MQINMIDEPAGSYRRRKASPLWSCNEALFKDPLTNMKAAKDIYDRQGLNAWSVYKHGAYLDFLR